MDETAKRQLLERLEDEHRTDEVVGGKDKAMSTELSEERLAEIREKALRYLSLLDKDAFDLLIEVDRLRAEVKELEYHETLSRRQHGAAEKDLRDELESLKYPR